MRDELIELLKKEPFRAFRILLAGGHAYEVHNPDMLVVERDIATHYGKGELYSILRLVQICALDIIG